MRYLGTDLVSNVAKGILHHLEVWRMQMSNFRRTDMSAPIEKIASRDINPKQQLFDNLPGWVFAVIKEAAIPGRGLVIAP